MRPTVPRRRPRRNSRRMRPRCAQTRLNHATKKPHGAFLTMSFRFLAMAFSIALPFPAFAQTDLKTIAKSSGTPDIPGLKMVWLSPGAMSQEPIPGKTSSCTRPRGGGLGARRRRSTDRNPTRRGVMVWVETDGTVYWAVADNLVPTHTDGADRNDNKYVDNSKTYHQVNRTPRSASSSPAIIPT